jgi:hypothetical protein
VDSLFCGDCFLKHNKQHTSTADWLYEKYGFIKIPKPELYMELFDPNVYKAVN